MNGLAKSKDVFVGHDGYNLERFDLCLAIQKPRNFGEIRPSKGFFQSCPLCYTFVSECVEKVEKHP